VREFHKPVRRPGDFIEVLMPSSGPSESLAHDSADAFLHRVRASNDPALAERVVEYAQEHGVDDVAELWAESAPDTLPGALWRLYLLRHVVASDATLAGLRFRQGISASSERDVVVAGAPHAPSPDEVVELANTIFRGAFAGDFSVALYRAASFARIEAAGAEDLGREDERRVAERFAFLAEELEHAAKLWLQGRLA